MKFTLTSFLCAFTLFKSVSSVTENALFDAILESTNYDFREPPKPSEDEPLEVRTSVYVYFLGHIEDERLEVEVHFMIRQRWSDPRLRFLNAAEILPDGVFKYVHYNRTIW